MTERHTLQESELQIDDPSVLAALYDSLRYRLFRLLESPRSVAELAAEVGMPANRLYYHVRRLVDCGLVKQVDTRPSGKHTERIYGRAAARIRFSGDVEVYGGGFLRGVTDELEAGLKGVVDDAPGSISYHTVTLTSRRAKEFESRLRDLLAEYAEANSTARTARRFGVLGVLAPLPGEGGRLMVIRDLASGETAFLQEMLYTALAWRPGVELPPKEWVLEHPQVVVFHKGWGRVGDSALVAEDLGRPVGAVWYRIFTEAEHGEGYVDEDTPELAIAVVEDARGRGVGRILMQQMHERARHDGLERISLSVNADNPAKRLYAALGYVDYEPGDGLGRMILHLR